MRLATLSDPETGDRLDRAMTLWLPGPATVTGEDMAEFHCHGGRAVVAAIEAALASFGGFRRAEPGEFTRRAFENGKLDLNEVEGLSDLLAAQTQAQRRSAMLMAEGHFSRRIAQWQESLLQAAALTEAALDFSDEDDVPDDDIDRRIIAQIMDALADMEGVLQAPLAERLHEGVRVVLAGPPNAGKSTLLNALVGRDVAIVSDIAGTTRDRIEAPMALDGIPFLFTDTAGLRGDAADAVEQIGIDRAKTAIDSADIILWLGSRDDTPRDDAILLSAKADLKAAGTPGLPVSAVTGDGMAELVALLKTHANAMLPAEGDFALHRRQRNGVKTIVIHLKDACDHRHDLLLLAEDLRMALRSIDALTGRAGTEDMLDRLFAGFCIGK